MVSPCSSNLPKRILMARNKSLFIVMQPQSVSFSEWGMRMIQAQFPRITDILLLEEERRQAILHVAVLIYNFTTSEVGINQILNTYMRDEGLRFTPQMVDWNSL
mmetsp:Transcript_16580/g.40528  ORF Transcript_16580/g.40528 Transcript_16580/m.40528 type:complete len:104 (-) Transcript_16580:37-348(-)